MEGFYLDLDPYCKNCKNFEPKAEVGRYCILKRHLKIEEVGDELYEKLHPYGMIIQCMKRKQCSETARQIQKNQPCLSNCD